jgi:hypothetical protein
LAPQNRFGQETTSKRRESCCGRSFAIDRISAKKRLASRAAPIAPIQEARRESAIVAKCLLAGQYRSKDSRRQGIAKSSRLLVKRASVNSNHFLGMSLNGMALKNILNSFGQSFRRR